MGFRGLCASSSVVSFPGIVFFVLLYPSLLLADEL